MWACAAGLLIAAFAPALDPCAAPRGAAAAIVPAGDVLAPIGGAAAVIVRVRGRGG